MRGQLSILFFSLFFSIQLFSMDRENDDRTPSPKQQLTTRYSCNFTHTPLPFNTSTLQLMLYQKGEKGGYEAYYVSPDYFNTFRVLTGIKANDTNDKNNEAIATKFLHALSQLKVETQQWEQQGTSQEIDFVMLPTINIRPLIEFLRSLRENELK